MLFNYSTLKVDLDPKTRSMQVLLKREENGHTLNFETLFELESLCSWLTSHIEVNSVLISSTGDTFCAGFCQDELKVISQEKLKKFTLKFQQLIHGILHLPQTIICDLKKGAEGIGAELALAADIRIAHEECQLKFNSLQNGLTPNYASVSLLSILAGQGRARAWTMGSRVVNIQELFQSGLVTDKYLGDRKEKVQNLLSDIAKQSPVARIQTKRSFLEAALPELERALNFAPNFSFASMVTMDWKKAANDDHEQFTMAREVVEVLKKDKQAGI